MPVKWLDSNLDRFDAFQRRHSVIAFPHAVFKRYGEDRGGWLGAVISYYGFFSLLPALLAFVTIVYLVLGEQPTLLTNVLADRNHLDPDPYRGGHPPIATT